MGACPHMAQQLGQLPHEVRQGRLKLLAVCLNGDFGGESQTLVWNRLFAPPSSCSSLGAVAEKAAAMTTGGLQPGGSHRPFSCFGAPWLCRHRFVRRCTARLEEAAAACRGHRLKGLCDMFVQHL